ncbi:MAG: DnaA/Hda family protein [Pseudomonadota bacterium]
MTAKDQIPLELGFAPTHNHDDFFVTDCNRAAFRAITDWTDWPDGRLALTGPAGSGKTHLTAIWAAKTCGVTLPAIDLTEKALQSLLLERAVAIEDVDCLAGLPTSARRQCETLLFHLFNFAGAEGMSLLLTGRLGPAHWLIQTPDLASRCAAMAHIAILPPDDEVLASVLIKQFSDRRLDVPAEVIQYLLVRMERSFDAAERIVEDLDRLALARRRRITRQLAGEVFDAYAEGSDQAPAHGDMVERQGD